MQATDYERVERVIRHLERHHREQPSLEDLAGVAGLSKFHFHRLFSRWAGTTPKAFLKYLTAEHAKHLLGQSRDVLSVALETGLSGPGRLHDLLVSVEGMTPGELKAGGAGVAIRYGFHATPFGRGLIGVTGRGICHLAFVGDDGDDAALAELREAWPRAAIERDPEGTAPVVAEAIDRRRARSRSVLVAASPFRLEVWRALLRIPPGRTVSYGAVAEAIGRPGASRAVASAIADNPVAVLIPCHRVIRESGVVGGYRWGAARKKAILAWESARPSR